MRAGCGRGRGAAWARSDSEHGVGAPFGKKLPPPFCYAMGTRRLYVGCERPPLLPHPPALAATHRQAALNLVIDRVDGLALEAAQRRGGELRVARRLGEERGRESPADGALWGEGGSKRGKAASEKEPELPGDAWKRAGDTGRVIRASAMKGCGGSRGAHCPPLTRRSSPNGDGAMRLLARDDTEGDTVFADVWVSARWPLLGGNRGPAEKAGVL